MSNIRVFEATLPGFKGPYFDGLEAVQHLYAGDLQRINEVFLSDVRKSFASLKGTEPAKSVTRLISTKDKYKWMFNVGFTYYGRDVCVLLPGVLDSTMEDGTHAERHVALYYRGPDLTHEELMRIMRRATSAFEDTYDATYGHIA